MLPWVLLQGEAPVGRHLLRRRPLLQRRLCRPLHPPQVIPISVAPVALWSRTRLAPVQLRGCVPAGAAVPGATATSAPAPALVPAPMAVAPAEPAGPSAAKQEAVDRVRALEVELAAMQKKTKEAVNPMLKVCVTA